MSQGPDQPTHEFHGHAGRQTGVPGVRHRGLRAGEVRRLLVQNGPLDPLGGRFHVTPASHNIDGVFLPTAGRIVAPDDSGGSTSGHVTVSNRPILYHSALRSDRLP